MRATKVERLIITKRRKLINSWNADTKLGGAETDNNNV